MDEKQASEVGNNMSEPSHTHVHTEVLNANRDYVAAFGDKKDLALPPARGFAILTCMDARLDPAKYAGLSEGDAHVIRNAGGRATDDAIRSLVISHKLLGTKEWFVIHHTNCGMELFSDEIIGDLLEDKSGDGSLRRRDLEQSETWKWLRPWSFHQVAYDFRQRTQRRAGCTPHPRTPARCRAHSHLRLYLRREDGTDQ